jgi:hypothetical protein
MSPYRGIRWKDRIAWLAIMAALVGLLLLVLAGYAGAQTHTGHRDEAAWQRYLYDQWLLRGYLRGLERLQHRAQPDPLAPFLQPGQGVVYVPVPMPCAETGLETQEVVKLRARIRVLEGELERLRGER